MIIIWFGFSPIVYGAPISSKQIDWDSYYSQEKPWGIFAYYTRMTNKILIRVLQFDIDTTKGDLYSLELNSQVSKENFLNKIFGLVGAQTGFALNATYQNDPRGDIYELNPFFRATWENFPWNKYLVTTASIGEGVSFASDIPEREIRDAEQAEKATKMLNFLIFECSFALPSHPDIQFVYRIHHRSGAFGLYNSSNSGSTAIGFGLRYLF